MVRFIALVSVALAAAVAAEGAERIEHGVLARRQPFAGGFAGVSSLGLPPLFNPFGNVISMIAHARSVLVPGCQPQVAIQQLTQIANQFSTVINPLGGCGWCGLGATQIDSFGAIVSQLVGGFQSIIGSCQSIFGAQWTNIVSTSWNSFNNVFPNFLNYCHTIGLPFDRYFGGQFLPTFRTLGFNGVVSSFNHFGFK